jgi:UDP-N-acetylmuramyl pentapeptide phosphotransferase/UDP-N-acetylglucosamine-1-phosphate transferase
VAKPTAARRSRSASPLTRVGLAAGGLLAARGILAAVAGTPAGIGLQRTNFRGRTLTLAGGPALAVAAASTAALGGDAGASPAALVAGLGCGAVGLYDDVAGSRPGHQAAKGFRGHLSALRQGRVTSGAVKILGVGAAGLAAAVLLAADDPRPRKRRPSGRAAAVLDIACGAGVVAGTANLLNLLDLRPGRALKAGLLLGAPMAAGPGGGLLAGPVGAAAGLLPADLGEVVMLGDAGANALGAVLGVGLAARTGPLGRAALLLGLAGLTAASEKVSFTEVIQDTPVLRRLDELGRRRD